MAELITCSLCGTRYEPDSNRSGCQSCSLHGGCVSSCCPNCGAANIDPDQSGLARLVKRILAGKGGKDVVSPPPTLPGI